MKPGVDFLLDISHAFITARTWEMSPEDYFSRLPLYQIKEMHFAGIHQDHITGRLIDHLSILEEDWHYLDWVLARIRSGEWNHPGCWHLNMAALGLCSNGAVIQR